eukprot:GEMP01005960.1.p1 GENE.GEMP01005960.1~~GEMP01005960.1.p1  ORF type:complete len:354 (+),score=48.12 GEMP01005960.1:1005-2066(+)
MAGARHRSFSSSPTAGARGNGYFKVRDAAQQQEVAVTQWIVQKYIERPMLISGRKFDIRVWVVVTPSMHVYMCKEGYVRTAARKYNLNPQTHTDSFMHLCNNAIQKQGSEYSKYEDGNQLGFKKFQIYLESTTQHKDIDVVKQMVPRMQELVCLSMQSVRHHFLRPSGSQGIFKQVSFQLFGYDFMLDEEGEIFLIEVNSNPCLEQSSAMLSDLIPRMLDEMFKICIDPSFGRRPQENDLQLFELLMCLKNNQDLRNGRAVERMSNTSPHRRATVPRSRSPTIRRGQSPPAFRSAPTDAGVRASSVSPAGLRLGSVSPTAARHPNPGPGPGFGAPRSRRVNISDPRCPCCFRL